MKLKPFILAGLVAIVALPVQAGAQSNKRDSFEARGRALLQQQLGNDDERPRARQQDNRDKDARDNNRGGQSPQPARVIPISQVISSISRRTPGRLLNNDLTRRGDRQVYLVRWQTDDGRRIDYVVDASNGAILSADGG